MSVCFETIDCSTLKEVRRDVNRPSSRKLGAQIFVVREVSGFLYH